MLARIGYNFLQLFVVLAFTAMIEGVAGRLKEALQSKRGLSILQPFRDIWKRLQLATLLPRRTINKNKLHGAVIAIRIESATTFPKVLTARSV
jgi:formate hydrogenlyase subunit 4